MYHLIDHLVPRSGRHSLYALVNGIAWMAWRTGRRYLEAGNRSYARACAGLLDHTTVGEHLRRMRSLPPGIRPLELRSRGRGVQGDLYELVIPPGCEHVATDPAEWPQPRPIPGVFGVRRHGARARLLGITGWRLYQVLAEGMSGTPTRLAHAAGISRSEAYAVLPELQRLGLARREDDTNGWEVGDASTAEAGDQVDAGDYLAAIDRRHAHERRVWRLVLAELAARRDAVISFVPDDPEPLLWPPDWADRQPPPDDDAPPDPAGWTPTGLPLLDAEISAIELLVAAFDAQFIG